jgi:hypothetical protein
MSAVSSAISNTNADRFSVQAWEAPTRAWVIAHLTDNPLLVRMYVVT